MYKSYYYYYYERLIAPKSQIDLSSFPLSVFILFILNGL